MPNAPPAPHARRPWSGGVKVIHPVGPKVIHPEEAS